MAAEFDASPVLRAALIMAAGFVLYVLSTGPVLRYARKPSGLLPTWVESAYAPLAWATRRCPPVSAGLIWYVGLWDSAAGATV